MLVVIIIILQNKSMMSVPQHRMVVLLSFPHPPHWHITLYTRCACDLAALNTAMLHSSNCVGSDECATGMSVSVPYFEYECGIQISVIMRVYNRDMLL